MSTRFLGTWSPRERLLRLARFTWTRGQVGDGQGYSAKFTVGLCLRLFCFGRTYAGWRLALCGLRLGYQRSYGGIFPR
jgi:hypothetical protein